MATHTANEEPRTEESRILLWRRVGRYAVPASMIETATARRRAGDWAGACSAAHIDHEIDLRSRRRRLRRGRGLQLRPAVPAFGGRARCGAAEPAPHPATGRRRDRHVRVGQRP
ncbi:hypothetical protein GCM10009535_21700 [Streptomyces thermocarboxydovorans]|uniref:Uncharacterized protein n=1 Tax=Streptomyces thermocarboxydovorans TaxID=59298 RepID=A0ABP3SJG3_9ACTN